MDGEFFQQFFSTMQGPAALLGFSVLAASATVVWEVGVVAVLAMSLLETQLGIDLGFPVAGYTVSPFDLVAMGLLIAAFFRILVAGRMTCFQFLWLVILGYGFLCFAVGVGSFGLQPAVSFYRQHFYVLAALSYSLTVAWTPPRLGRLVQIWLIAGTALAALAAGEWLLGGVIPRGRDWTQGSLYAFDQVRVLPAASALILAQAGLAGLAVWSQIRSSLVVWVLSIVLLLVSFSLFHRSVWGATFAGLGALLTSSRQRLARFAPFLLLGGVGLALLWMLYQGMGGNLLTLAFQSAIEEPFTTESSLGWRITGWKLLLERVYSSGWPTILFGAGYGAGYERQIGWTTVFQSPHNFYIAMLLDTGLVGVGLWVYGFARTAAGLLARLPAGLAEWRPCLVSLLATIVIYDIPYNHLSEQGVWLGALAGIAAAGGAGARSLGRSPARSPMAWATGARTPATVPLERESPDGVATGQP
ncbi:hypothetical protein [Azospirillum palustre]|uniref:hypothetical protein n=1 Tax=Azospirillum palustre TaxID=2044885 RepID=UPI00137B36D2|nr:hypothetical protein [Azospirillum palustre]